MASATESNHCTDLVGFDRRDFFVLLDIVANALGKLFQGTFRDRFGHLGHLNNLVGVVADSLHHRWEHDHGVAGARTQLAHRCHAHGSSKAS